MTTWHQRNRNQRIRRNVKLACFVGAMLLVFGGLLVLSGCALKDAADCMANPDAPCESDKE